MQQPLVRVGCAILLLYAAVLFPLGIAHAGAPADDGRPDWAWTEAQATVSEPGGGSQSPPLEPDSVVLSVTVYENGTAQWRIEYRTLLEDRATRDAFRSLQRDLNNGSTAPDRDFYSRINASIAAAENATGREMAVTEFAADATVRRLPQEYGVVVYRFRWQGFAAVSEERLRVGDALGGFFLGDNERLLISWPRGYQLAEIRPEPDTQRDRTVVWNGPREFGPHEPRVLLTERVWPGPEFLRVAAAAALLALLVLLVWVRRRGDAVPSRATELFDRREDGSDLLSNEEKVVELLERRGGRVKQQAIADELGWTETKTSYVVSNLREEGRIDSFRLGRENVLSLSDHNADERRA